MFLVWTNIPKTPELVGFNQEKKHWYFSPHLDVDPGGMSWNNLKEWYYFSLEKSKLKVIKRYRSFHMIGYKNKLGQDTMLILFIQNHSLTSTLGIDWYIIQSCHCKKSLGKPKVWSTWLVYACIASPPNVTPWHKTFKPKPSPGVKPLVTLASTTSLFQMWHINLQTPSVQK